MWGGVGVGRLRTNVDGLLQPSSPRVTSRPPTLPSPQTSLHSGARKRGPGGGRGKLLIYVRHLDTERGRQIDLVILFLHQDFADLLGHGEFAEHLALPDAVAVIANGLVLVVEIEP